MTSNSPNTECNCKEMTCQKDCGINHTHKGFSCEKCVPKPVLPNTECCFCDTSKIKSAITKRDGCLIFEPLNPVVEGHLLVIPDNHVADFTSDSITTECVMRVAGLIALERGGDYNLITSKGKNATQSVFHFHVHLIPRKENDGLLLPWTKSHCHTPELSLEGEWEKKIVSDFREKWGQFYFSDLVGMDWEKPKKRNFRPDEEAQVFGSDGRCIASGDIEKDLVETIHQELSRARKETLNDILEEIEGKIEKLRISMWKDQKDGKDVDPYKDVAFFTLKNVSSLIKRRID